MVVFVGIVMLWSHGWPPSTWIRPDMLHLCRVSPFFSRCEAYTFCCSHPQSVARNKFSFQTWGQHTCKGIFSRWWFYHFSHFSVQEFVRHFFGVTEERKSNCCKDFWFVFDCVVNIYMIGETSLGESHSGRFLGWMTWNDIEWCMGPVGVSVLQGKHRTWDKTFLKTSSILLTFRNPMIS